MTDLFPLYIVGWAAMVVTLMLVWIFLIWCGDEMKDAWDAMKGREWRWPEGPLQGPGQDK